jgi:hypothetical protein
MTEKTNIKHKEVILTKADAEQLLKKNKCGREINQKYVEYLQQRMDSPECSQDYYGPDWDHDQYGAATPVVVADDGALVDGQHRLTAFLKSKMNELKVDMKEGFLADQVKFIDNSHRAPNTLEELKAIEVREFRENGQISYVDKGINRVPAQR